MPPLVVACSDKNRSAQSLLELALGKALFWQHIEIIRTKTNLPKEDFKILIKPDLEIFEAKGPTGTDPSIVEHLIELLAAKGYRNIVVADAESASGSWLCNREVFALTDLVGYRYKTQDGTSYDIVSLNDKLVDGCFNEESLLHAISLSAYWLDADYRIVFAKNKTDEERYYSLCLESLTTILPLKEKWNQFYLQHKPEEIAAELLDRNEVHFCLVDAYVSNHGMQGSRYPRPIETKTFIGSTDLLLVDWIGALKMGLDPYASSLSAFALKRRGLPKKYKIEGDLSIYPGWLNVPKLLCESVQKRNANPLFRQLAKTWLQTVDTSLFPFQNVIDGQVNQNLVPIVSDIDSHPLAYGALVTFNYVLAGVNNFITAYNTLYDKEKIYRQQTQLGFDIAEFADSDYEDIVDYITPLQQIVTHVLPDENGLKWRYLNESVLFEFTRTLPYDFEDFVAKVDISKSVRLMFDNIGGAISIVKRDKQGNVIHQAERDIYLPQPNWLVLFGGVPIDVCKIEIIKFNKRNQTIYWRTVGSPNSSAEFDDGMVTFSAVRKGITRITIVARQKFTLPLFMQVFSVDNFPKVKNALVADSYTKFFNKTIVNFEALCEGRDPRIGRDFNLADDAASLHQLLKIDQLKNVLAAVSGLVEKITSRRDGPGSGEDVDENGYRHFGSAGDGSTSGFVQEFVRDLSGALKKDIQLITDKKLI